MDEHDLISTVTEERRSRHPWLSLVFDWPEWVWYTLIVGACLVVLYLIATT